MQPPDTQVLLLVGGAAACLLALLWRFLSRHRQTSRLVGRLENAVPEERARAGQTLIDLGLRRAARPVLHAMDQEPDDRVRLSVALAVARRQWEPAGPTRVGSLRRWAAEELDFQGRPVTNFGPAVTRLADMGGPRQPDQPSPGTNGNDTGTPAPANPAEAPTVVLAPPLDEPTRPDGYAPEPGIHWVAPGS